MADRIYFDLGTHYLRDEYIVLEKNRQISLIARLDHPITIKLYFRHTCIANVGLCDDK